MTIFSDGSDTVVIDLLTDPYIVVPGEPIENWFSQATGNKKPTDVRLDEPPDGSTAVLSGTTLTITLANPLPPGDEFDVGFSLFF